MRSIQVLAAALASIVVFAGCDKARPLPAPADPSGGCVSCHGGQESSTGAPPWSLPRNAAGDIVASGNRLDATASTTRVEVGAHTGHVSRGVSCGACHVVPTQISSPGHNTGKRATVTFKELAAAGNVIPSAWNADPGAASHTCTNYCHGSSLNAGGSLATHAPDWLKPADGACGTCHFAAGVTPPATHPQGPGAAGAFTSTIACATCHTETVNAKDGSINVTGGRHVNGVLDGGGGHPVGWYDPANPPGTHGPAATSGLQSCATCHGADFGGAGTPAMDCNACHATSGHPFWQSECTFCHGSATRAADAGFPLVPTPLPAGANASLQVRANLASPPLGSQGENAIAAYAVGAHQAHVSPTRFADAVPCGECHGPSLPADLAHVGGTVLLGWGPVAASNGSPLAPPAGETNRWSDATLPVNGANCTNYCHGATLGGGTHPSPKWNEGAAGASCGSCHALPPATSTGHVPRSDCATCHPNYPSSPVVASTITGAALATHVDGAVQVVALTCVTCHGGSAGNIAPPNDTGGNATGVKVGAHQKHLATTLTAAALGCGECHPPVGSTRHADGAVNITWNLGATVWAGATFPAVTPPAGPLAAAWEATPTCTNYCHGGFTNGKAATVSWTSAVAMTCNDCHGRTAGATASEPTGTHPFPAASCGGCHTGYSASAVNQLAHLNGLLDVNGSSCSTCHTAVTDTDSFTFGTAGVIGTTEWTSTGHGQTTTNGFTAANAFPTIAAGQPCLYCHDGSVVHDLAANPFRLLGPTPAGGVPPVTNGFNSAGANVGNDVCLNCHATGSNGVAPAAQVLRNGANKIGGWHYGTKHTGLAGGQRCWDCHDPHGDGNSKMIGKTVAKLANNAQGFGAAGRVTATFTRSATPVGSDYVDATAGASTKICQVCHTTTAHYTSTTSDSHNIGVAGGCISCHTHDSATVSTAFAIPAGGGTCTGCHATAQGTRRPIVPEFAQAWSHKRSGGGTVTNNDCAVCHMEGNVADGSVNATFHLYAPGGAIDLRDPDTGLHIKGVTFNAASGASPGSYTSTAADATFVSFSRDLGVTLEADPNAATLQAIMINLCLKCHDANGALSPSARVPTTGTAEKPFGTTIAGAGYTGAGVTANGVAGGVADVNESFKTTNSSYHPVTGKQNNWYAKLTRMVAPWTSARTGTVANTTSWGALLSCWDCHAPSGTASTATLTATVTAHGGATTLRGTATATGNPSATTGVKLCILCHAGYDTSTIVSHGPNSAWSSTGADSGMNNYIHFGCNACHSSGYSTAVVRPLRAQDVHGVNALPAGGATPQAGSRWAGASVGTPAQVNARPYAFIRNTTQLINHQPASIGGSTYTATCRGTASPCANNMNNYTPGGVH